MCYNHKACMGTHLHETYGSVEEGVKYEHSNRLLHCNDDIRHFEFCLCHLSQS